MPTKNFPKKAVKDVLFTVESPNELMKFLIEKFPSKSRDNIKSLLRNKMVLVNEITQSQYNFPLEKGHKVSIGRKEIKTQVIPGLKILHEDQDIIVVNKPAGLLTVSTAKERQKTLFHFLSLHVKKQDPDNKIFIVHRIDRETSGLLVFAKNEKAKFTLQKNWNDTVLERTYIALVEGRVLEKTKTILSYLKESKALIVHSSKNETYGQKAVTHYEVIEQRKNTCLLKVNLETGRKNQIRVHMQEIGHPIVGDKKYGAKTPMVGRIALHAKTLVFIHPGLGKEVKFDSPIPSELN